MWDQPGSDYDQIPAPEPLKQSPHRKWIRLGLSIILILCLCVGAGGQWISNSIRKAVLEETNVGEVLNSFMEKMEAQEFEAAYNLFSIRAKGQFEIEEIRKMGGGSNIVLFEGYQDLQINQLNLRTAFNTDPAQAQGKVAEVEGFVFYENDIYGTLTAVLEKEDDVWRLHYINVVVPPEKFEDYYNGQKDI